MVLSPVVALPGIRRLRNCAGRRVPGMAGTYHAATSGGLHPQWRAERLAKRDSPCLRCRAPALHCTSYHRPVQDLGRAGRGVHGSDGERQHGSGNRRVNAEHGP